MCREVSQIQKRIIIIILAHSSLLQHLSQIRSRIQINKHTHTHLPQAGNERIIIMILTKLKRTVSEHIAAAPCLALCIVVRVHYNIDTQSILVFTVYRLNIIIPVYMKMKKKNQQISAGLLYGRTD